MALACYIVSPENELYTGCKVVTMQAPLSPCQRRVEKHISIKSLKGSQNWPMINSLIEGMNGEFWQAIVSITIKHTLLNLNGYPSFTRINATMWVGAHSGVSIWCYLWNSTLCQVMQNANRCLHYFFVLMAWAHFKFNKIKYISFMLLED